MNILFIWISPFKDGGGVGRVTTTLGEEFMHHGHRVYYLSSSKGKEYINDNIPQFFSPDDKKPSAKKNIEYLKNIIIEKDINIIINQAGLSDPDILKTIDSVKSLLDKDLKVLTVHHNCIKCLYTYFELIIKDNYRNHWLYPVISNGLVLKLLKRRHKKKYRNILNYLIEKSDSLVLLSEKFIPELDTYLEEVPEKKVADISNPAPFESRDVEHKKENRLVYVGRINFHQKRVDLLIQLWKKLYLKYPNWELDVVGDGDALNMLKKMAQNANLERIHFHGYQDPKPYLEKAKYFIMTSAFEGFPMVLVEAQAYGVVPLAFNSFSSLTDIIDHDKNGIIIEPYNIEDYVYRLEKLIEDEKRRYGIAKCARESIREFHPKKITRDWEDLFRDVKRLEPISQAKL